MSNRNINFPKYHIKIPKSKVPTLETPELLFMQTKSIPPDYESTMYAKMANDIKSSYEKQLNEIADTLNEQLSIAKAETASAKKEARISKIIAIVSIIITVATGIIQLFL